MQRVPFGILRQAVVGGGKKLPKIESLIRDSDVECTWTSQRSTYTPPRATLFALPAATTRATTPETGLPHTAYRWYMGKSGADNWAKCRACDLVMVDGTKRALAAHMAGACKTLILDCMQLLRRDGLCVLCDKKCVVTNGNIRGVKTKWGVPLCSTNCEKAWMYFQPISWIQARGLAIKTGGVGEAVSK